MPNRKSGGDHAYDGVDDDGSGGGGDVVDDDKQQLDEEVANVGDGVPMPELCSPVFPGNRTETIGFVYFLSDLDVWKSFLMIIKTWQK